MNTILVVDDDADLRDAFQGFLEIFGYKVFSFSSGGEALEFLENNKVSLVITDLVMPNMNGLELSKIIREKYKDLRILMLTGYADMVSAFEAIEIGITNYLIKPIDCEQLEKLLRNTFA